MKKFELTPHMQTMGGTFYPTGYVFIMFADAEDAAQVAREVDEALGGEVMLLDPATIERDIGQVKGGSDVPLPSVGTEGATVLKYVQFAREGHHAVMAKVSSSEQAERIMAAARKAPFSYAQRYHMMAMEDLE